LTSLIESLWSPVPEGRHRGLPLHWGLVEINVNHYPPTAESSLEGVMMKKSTYWLPASVTLRLIISRSRETHAQNVIRAKMKFPLKSKLGLR